MDSSNKDGTYDKYRIQLDDEVDWYYEKVTNFEIFDNKFTPKHYSKSTTLKWGPWSDIKPKAVLKQKILKQTYERKARAQSRNKRRKKK